MAGKSIRNSNGGSDGGRVADRGGGGAVGRGSCVGKGSGVLVGTGKGVGGSDVGEAGGTGVVDGAVVGVGDGTSANAGPDTTGLATTGKWMVCPVSCTTPQTNVAVGTIGIGSDTGGDVTSAVVRNTGVNVGNTLIRSGDEVGSGIGCGSGSDTHAPKFNRSKSPTTRCQMVKEYILSSREGGSHVV